MNIEACRVPFKNCEDLANTKAKCTFTEASDNTRGFGGSDITYGAGIPTLEQANATVHNEGRFPPNVILDEVAAVAFDEQTSITKSVGGSGLSSRQNRCQNTYGMYKDTSSYQNESLGGYGDIGGGSRIFPIMKYNPKISPSERLLPSGKRNPHVTVKPIELISWLIKLLTPTNGKTIDITAGSCTHAVACETLNREDNYHLQWIDIELMNTETDPYCMVGAERIKGVNSGKPIKLF